MHSGHGKAALPNDHLAYEYLVSSSDMSIRWYQSFERLCRNPELNSADFHLPGICLTEARILRLLPGDM